jgi:hypothetical protein
MSFVPQGSHERSSDKRKQGDDSSPPSLRFPAFEFPAAESHASLPFTAADDSIRTGKFMPREEQTSDLLS